MNTTATMALLTALTLLESQGNDAPPEMGQLGWERRPSVDGHSVCRQKKWRGKKLSKRQRKGEVRR
jgi:hypothetical protein